MTNNDFIIENGVLKKYVGEGGNVVIPEGVLEIDAQAFFLCENLTGVTFPKSLEKIGAEAFQACSNLSEIKNLENIKSIGDSAFWDCKKLADKNGFVIVKDILFHYVGTEADITIPEGVTTISQGAFADCDINSAVIPDGLKRIGDNAFDGCENLSSIKIPDSAKEIDDGAFFNCKKLADKAGFVIINNVLYDYIGQDTDIVIPTGTTAISELAFLNAEDYLKSVFIPKSVTKIDDYIFSALDDDKNITIYGYIGSYAEQYAKEHNIPFVAE